MSSSGGISTRKPLHVHTTSQSLSNVPIPLLHTTQSSPSSSSSASSPSPSSLLARARLIKPIWISTATGASIGVLLIMSGCCLNVMSLELLTRSDAGLGNLITCAQFVFIATEGFVSRFDWRTCALMPRQIPLSVYAKITSIFFITSVLNNKALDYSISIPVHTVFRSSGLTATLILGRWLYRMRYTMRQVIACFLVTFGILAVTLADAFKPRLKACCDEASAEVTGTLLTSSIALNEASAALFNITSLSSLSNALGLFSLLSWHELFAFFGGNTLFLSLESLLASISLDWMIGILMLFTALFLSAYLGHEQDRTYKLYGKETWKELMFYSHLFALPAFLLAAPDIARHGLLLFQAPAAEINLFHYTSIATPLWLILLLNLALQAVCIRGVYLLTTHTNTLTCNLAITARKLVSLLLSVLYFGNVFTIYHWIGSGFVFLGVLVYTNINNPQELMKSPLASPSAQEVTQLQKQALELKQIQQQQQQQRSNHDRHYAKSGDDHEPETEAKDDASQSNKGARQRRRAA